MRPPPVVSVTIVLHNSAQGLSACLASLKPELDEGFAELIVVDNASPDASVEVAREIVPDVRVIASESNVGFAAGANLAWPAANGRYWFLLNPDVALATGALRSLARWLDDHPHVGVASAELVRRDRAGIPSTGRALPSLWRPLLEVSRLHLLLPPRLRARLFRGAYWRGGDQVNVGWVPGTALLARRAAVEGAGLLDERFFLYGEDIEWCWRMQQHGWAIGVCSTAIAEHEESSSAESTFGELDVRSRMVRGELQAVELVRGKMYAAIYGRATALALRAESLHPFRSREQKRNAMQAARLWSAAAKGGPQ